MIPRMKPALWILPCCALALILSSCGNSGPNNPDAITGPFDSNGNYREEWADNPSKWRKSGGSPTPHELRTDQLPEIAGNTDQPPSNSVPIVSSSSGSTTRVISQTRVAEKPKSVTKVVSAPKPKPKPRPKPVKVKPKSLRYTVRKGDSLSAIASRNGSSVSAIRRANGISGSLIRPGQVLTVPKR
jgi:LysM repeat protein